MDTDFTFHEFSEETLELQGKVDSYFVSILKRFIGDKKAMVGVIAIFIVTLLAIFGPSMSPFKYSDIVSVKSGDEVVLAKSLNPFSEFNGHLFVFGTDDIGRDLWVRSWRGARVSLIIAAVSIFVNVIVGMSYGLVSGFCGGRTDNVMQRLTEIINSIPTLVIISVLAIFVPKGIPLVITLLAITEWIGMSKIARAQMLKNKNLEYVMASRTLGASNFRIIFGGIMPNTIGPIITQVLFSIPGAIFTEAFLSFVGVGITPPDCSLGSLIEAGFESISSHPYQILPPILIFVIIIIGFSAIGEGMKRALNPKMEDI